MLLLETHIEKVSAKVSAVSSGGGRTAGNFVLYTEQDNLEKCFLLGDIDTSFEKYPSHPSVLLIRYCLKWTLAVTNS